MKKTLLIMAVLIFALSAVGCFEQKTKADPSADISAPYRQLIPGAVSDIFAESTHEVAVVDVKDRGNVYFTLNGDTVYQQYFVDTEETLDAERDALTKGSWVEIECESSHLSERNTALTVKIFDRHPNSLPILTMAELQDIVSKKGADLTWSDFKAYHREEIGSGLHILKYPINEDYCLIIGGTGIKLSPMYIRLVSEEDRESYIDVRYEDIQLFISEDIEAVSFVSQIHGERVPLSGEDSETVIQILGRDGWVGDVTKTVSDYIFELDGRTIYYSTDGGVFNEGEGDPFPVKGQSLRLSPDERAVIELIIEGCFRNKTQFVYEKETYGGIGEFVITLYEDGTYTYSEGSPSSHFAPSKKCRWTLENGVITLTEKIDCNDDMVNHFKYEDDCLIYIEEGSDGFLYIKPSNGEKFNIK